MVDQEWNPIRGGSREPVNAAPPEAWSDDYITEHAYLVARGVRPMAIVGHVKADADTMLTTASRLEIVSTGVEVVPFVVVRRDGWADCGFAAEKWVVDFYEWSIRSEVVPEEHVPRIRGLLLGYSADAIRKHDDRACGRRFTASLGKATEIGVMLPHG